MTIAVPTRGATPKAAALLRDAASAVRDNGVEPTLLIADDSGFDGWSATGEHVNHCSPRGRDQLVAELKASGCDPECVEFALADPLALGVAPGANRNVVQLLTGGRVALVLDDDLDFRFYLPGEVDDAVELRLDDPTELWFFREADEAAELLAAPAQAITKLIEGLSLDDPAMDGDVAAAWLGMMGDAGTPNQLIWLAPAGASRRRLMTDYAALRRSGRVMRAVRRPTACRGAAWTPAVVAYDNAQLLPPFLPVLRGQGLVWGACVRAGGAWSLARMPGALGHRLDSPRAVDRDLAEAATGSLAVAGLIHFALSRMPAAAPTSPEQALARAAAELGDLAAAIDFDARVSDLVRMRAAATASALRGLLVAHRREPEQWALDVDRALDGLDAVAAAPHRWVPYDLADHPQPRALLREIVRRFARLLEHWPRIADAARSVAPQA